MKHYFQLTRLDCALLVANLLAFGALLVLIALKGANGPLVFLAVGAGLAATAKLGQAYLRASKFASNAPQASPSSRP